MSEIKSHIGTNQIELEKAGWQFIQEVAVPEETMVKMFRHVEDGRTVYELLGTLYVRTDLPTCISPTGPYTTPMGWSADSIITCAAEQNFKLSQNQAQHIIDTRGNEIDKCQKTYGYEQAWDWVQEEITGPILQCDSCSDGMDVIGDATDGSFQMWDGHIVCVKCKRADDAVPCDECELYVPRKLAQIKTSPSDETADTKYFCPDCVNGTKPPPTPTLTMDKDSIVEALMKYGQQNARELAQKLDFAGPRLADAARELMDEDVIEKLPNDGKYIRLAHFCEICGMNGYTITTHSEACPKHESNKEEYIGGPVDNTNG